MNDIRVNGRMEISAQASGETVVELLARYGLDATTRGLAVAVNKMLVTRANWMTTQVTSGDEIEIVRPFQGG